MRLESRHIALHYLSLLAAHSPSSHKTLTCFLLPQQFLEKEHCEENILFWKEAREFSEKALHMSPVQLQAAAKKIYDQYLSPSSPHTVNVDDRAMKAVESRLDKPTPNVFAEAKEQVCVGVSHPQAVGDGPSGAVL